MRSLISLAAVVALAPAAFAQATPLRLDAGFFLNQFSPTANSTCYFDLTVTDPAGITLFNIDHNLLLDPGNRTLVDVRVVSGPGTTFLNNEQDALFWPAVPTISTEVISAGPGNPTEGLIPGGLFLPTGDHALAVTYEFGLPLITPNPGTNGAVSTPELAFSGGSVSPSFLAAPFTGPGALIFNGAFDYYSGNVPVASAVAFGDECPSFQDAATIIEQFDAASGLPADVTGTSVTFTPNGIGGFIVSGSAVGSGYVPPGPGATVLSLGDDTLSGPIALTNSVIGPDGNATNMVEVESNGRVFFGTGSNMAVVGGPFPFDILNAVPNVNIGADYDPSVGGTVTVEEIGTDVVFSWNAVPEFGTPNVLITQIVLDSLTGAITFRFELYFPIAVSNVAISQGAPFAAFADILFATDLSEAVNVPVDSGTNSVGIRATPQSTPILGSTLDIELGRVPPTSTGEFVLLGFSNPGFDLASSGAPGCSLFTSAEASFPATGTSVFSIGIPNNLGLQGLQLFLQAASFDPMAGNAFNLSLSNGVDATIQQQ